MGIHIGIGGLKIGTSQQSYWTQFWNSLVSATVENAAPTNVVLTFSKADTKTIASDFTIAGFTVSSLSRDATNKILTLTLSTSVIYGDTLVVVFKGKSHSVTNNVAAEAEATTIFGRMTAVGETPTNARKKILNTRIKQAKAAGLWTTKFDAFYLFASHGNDSMKLNLIQDAYNLTTVASPYFEEDLGSYGNASTLFWQTGFVPNTGVNKYTRNAASIGVISNGVNAAADTNVIGTNPASPCAGMTYLALRSSTDKFQARINTFAAMSEANNTNSTGLFVASRNSSTDVKLYVGTTETTTTKTSDGLSTKEFYICARNNDGAIINPSSNEIAVIFWGDKLSAADVASLKTIWLDGYCEDVKQDLFNVTTATKAQLTINTYDGSGQTVHPSVIDCGASWNGYRYWMGITPYPNGDSEYENPSIYCSSDGQTWVTPVGLTNPVIPSPAGALYNADPFLYFENNKLYMGWITDENPYSVYLSESTDGVNWSARQSIASINDFGETHNSVPSLIKVGLTYFLYYTDTLLPSVVKRRSSLSIYGPYINPEVITFYTPGKYYWNHCKIKYYNGKYYLTANRYLTAKNGDQIYMAVSDDGLIFRKDTLPIITVTTAPEATLYVSCFENIGGTLKIYYTVVDASADWWLMWATLTIV